MTAVQVLVLVLGVATPALALVLFKVREHLTAARKDAARLKAEKAELLGKLEATRAELNSSRTQVLELGRVRLELTQARDLSQQLQQRLADAEAKVGGISNVEAERARLVAEEQTLRAQIHAKRSQWEAQYAAATEELGRLQREVGALTEHAELQTFGLYKAHYDFGVSEIYKEELEDVRARQKEMVKAKTAATSTRKWVVDGSAAKGQQMLERQLKLMLRAFNGECDAAVAKVRFNNITALETRLQKSFEAVNQLGQSNECAISEGYLALKEAELRLTHEYAEKLQEEREEQKLIREQMREEEQVRREREEHQREAELEEQRVAAALEKARAQLLGAAQRDRERFNEKVASLEAQLAEAHARTERAVSQAQLTRAGHVYIISNEGSFGSNVFKVGMTRRLDPEERLRELSGAAVPFIFDVHAMIYSEDAPTLENQLHKTLTAARVNLVNERKEFFNVSLDQIEDAVAKCSGGRASFTRIAVAEEFRKSQAIRAERAAGAAREAQRLIDATNTQTASAAWTQRLAV